MTLPVTILQFTLTAELSHMASSSVEIDGVASSFAATSILFGNIVGF